MESVWSKDVTMPRFPPLDGDARTDVLIIGGGLAGVLCAYELRRAGVDCLLVEGSTVGSGITLGTTAKITAQHGLMGRALIQTLGPDRARLYVQANLAAVEDYRRLCAGLDCEFRDADSYVYSRDDRDLIEGELEYLDKLGCPAVFEKELELPFSVAGAVRVPCQAAFHPLKFLAGISRDLNIREHTFVRSLEKGRAFTDRGTVTAEQIVVATHFPFLDRHGGYFVKLYQERGYVLALKDAPRLEGLYRDADEKGLSFRSTGDYLLLGSGSHRTGKPSLGWRPLRETAARYWPEAQVETFWATQDCMSLDSVPYVGPYGKRTNGLYVVTGFRKWGMTSAMVAAQVLTAMLTGREHIVQPVLSPQRAVALPTLAANGMEAAMDFAMPLPRRCPHLGCALRWNRVEHTWDCPCHGSRFAENGALLDGPANEPL